MAVVYLIGERFGLLTVVSRAENYKDGSAQWNCLCDCGEKRIVTGTGLRAGRNKSCGCKSPKFKSKHGVETKYIGTRIYSIWIGMNSRCSDKAKGKTRKLYFDKSIRVCDRWKDFYNFLNDMGEPKDGETIERIDSNKNYCPENCKWATYKEQANNTSWNKIIEFNGIKKTLAQWGDEIGVKPNTILYRIRRGMAIDRALSKTNLNRRLDEKQKRSKECEHCKNIFIPRKSQIKNGSGKFCSQKCYGASRRR